MLFHFKILYISVLLKSITKLDIDNKMKKILTRSKLFYLHIAIKYSNFFFSHTRCNKSLGSLY